MMHSRKLNNKINWLHEGYLRIPYNDGLYPFEELLERDNSVSVHNRNIQSLAIELYKVLVFVIPSTKVWELIRNNIKSLGHHPKFKKPIKYWKPDVCPSRLCRLYIPQVSFVLWV